MRILFTGFDPFGGEKIAHAVFNFFLYFFLCFFCFHGPSGIGKTTLAKFIETKYGIPFISGSMSDLMPDTKETVLLKCAKGIAIDCYLCIEEA